MCSSKIFPLYQYRVMEIITELIMAILLFLYMPVVLSSNAQFTIKSQTFCGTQAECQKKKKENNTDFLCGTLSNRDKM